MAVYNASGTEVMKITYDAWGNFTDTVSTMPYPPSIEQLQALAIPFRYRGYVYDQETGFYYLNSRYYDPVMHKFLNADSISYLGANGDLIGYNLYAYCGNNPVMNSDPSGHKWYDAILGLLTGRTILKATEAEAGIGLGMGVKGKMQGVEVKAEAYRDTTLYLKDGKLLLGNAVSAGASVANFGIGGSHDQYTSGDSDEVHSHCPSNNVFEDAQEIIDCPKCEHDTTSSYKNFGTPFKDPTSASIGASGHFIFGGHASASFSLFKAAMVFLEDWIK